MDGLKILVVDDEARMRKLVRDFLVKKEFTVLEAGDGEEALNLFYSDKDIKLIILDVMMPKMDGWEVCREIRRESKVPIIMLTARGDERDELMGFDLGVGAYLSTPFRRKEFELLTYFLENKGIALSREKILNNVWNYDYFGDARTIDTHVKKLRSKMGEKGSYIKTIWGMGYKFTTDGE